MKLAIMCCNTPDIEIHNIPDSIPDIEAFIEEHLGYNIDEVSWQCYEDKDINIRIC